MEVRLPWRTAPNLRLLLRFRKKYSHFDNGGLVFARQLC